MSNITLDETILNLQNRADAYLRKIGGSRDPTKCLKHMSNTKYTDADVVGALIALHGLSISASDPKFYSVHCQICEHSYHVNADVTNRALAHYCLRASDQVELYERIKFIKGDNEQKEVYFEVMHHGDTTVSAVCQESVSAAMFWLSQFESTSQELLTFAISLFVYAVKMNGDDRFNKILDAYANEYELESSLYIFHIINDTNFATWIGALTNYLLENKSDNPYFIMTCHAAFHAGLCGNCKLFSDPLYTFLQGELSFPEINIERMDLLLSLSNEIDNNESDAVNEIERIVRLTNRGHLTESDIPDDISLVDDESGTDILPDDSESM